MVTRLRSAAVLLLMSLTLAGGMGTMAHAAPPNDHCAPTPGKPAYPPGQCKKPAASDRTVVAGEVVTFYSGEGQFDAFALITITLSNGQVLGTVRADAQGGATFRYKIPGSLKPGTYNIIFTGDFFGKTRSVPVPFTVIAPGSSTSGGGSGFPFTGSYLGDALVLAIGLALIGGSTAVILRRRRATSTDPAPADQLP